MQHSTVQHSVVLCHESCGYCGYCVRCCGGVLSPDGWVPPLAEQRGTLAPLGATADTGGEGEGRRGEMREGRGGRGGRGGEGRGGEGRGGEMRGGQGRGVEGR